MRTGTRGTGSTTLTRTLRTRRRTPAHASSPISHFEFPPSAVSNRQWLTRLENAVTHRKQTPEVNSNRHIRDGRQIWDACFVQTPTSISPRLRLSPFSIFTFPFSNAPRGSFSAISNRHSLELETMSNPYKTKAGDAL